MALRVSGKLDEAAAELRSALAINPNYLPAHENLGIVLQGQGNKDDAIAEFRKILAIDPSNAAALRKLKELGDQ